MSAGRMLVVIGDDLGIGPQTTEGILELASLGVVTGTVLLTTSPHAEHGASRWREAGRPCDLGWHPCLTLDAPLSPPGDVDSLVDQAGQMGPLGRFLGRLFARQIRPEQVHRELLAQYQRFRDLTGQEPTLVNSHHHVALFPPVGAVLRDILRRQSRRPWVRRVCETPGSLRRIPGGRFKRLALATLGRLGAARQKRDGFPGADLLAGIGSPTAVDRGDFFRSWLARTPGRCVEMMCHPGRRDPTLLGRDAPAGEETLRKRVLELEQLRDPIFRESVLRAGFRLVRPSEIPSLQESIRHAA